MAVRIAFPVKRHLSWGRGGGFGEKKQGGGGGGEGGGGGWGGGGDGGAGGGGGGAVAGGGGWGLLCAKINPRWPSRVAAPVRRTTSALSLCAASLNTYMLGRSLAIKVCPDPITDIVNSKIALRRRQYRLGCWRRQSPFRGPVWVVSGAHGLHVTRAVDQGFRFKSSRHGKTYTRSDFGG